MSSVPVHRLEREATSILKGYKCRTVEEALQVLSENRGNAKVVSGGTDIVIAVRQRRVEEEILVDVFGIPELKRMERTGGFWEIGAALPFSHIAESGLPSNLIGLKKACNSVGSPQIRNRGTIGGNIANASTAADTVPMMVALRATAVIRSVDGERETPVEEMFDSREKWLKPDELLVKVRFRDPGKNRCLTSAKLGLRKALAISRMTVGLYLEVGDGGEITDVSVASGAIGKHAMREPDVEAFMKGVSIRSEDYWRASEVFQGSLDERLKGRSSLGFKREAIVGIMDEALSDALQYFYFGGERA